MAHRGRNGRSAPGVLRRLSVRVMPPLVPISRRRAPVPARPPGSGPPWPAPRQESLWSSLGDLATLGFYAVAGGIGFVVWQGVRVLQQPDPDAMSTARAVDLILLVTVMPPAVGWVVYRWFRPRPPGSPWEGKRLPPDPAGQAELMASPAAAIARAVAAVACLVALLAVAVRLSALAWIGVPLAAVLSVVLVAQLLRPTVLVVNERGFQITAWRQGQRLAVPWSDIDEVVRPFGDVVRIIPTPDLAGDLRPRLELRGAGTSGADQVAALLQSYLDAHRAAAAGPRHP